MNKGGEKKAAYDKAYNAKPEQVKNRKAKNKLPVKRQIKQLSLDEEVDEENPFKMPLIPNKDEKRIKLNVVSQSLSKDS